MSEEKDYVGLEVCFFCGEDAGVVLDGRLKKTLPHRAVYDRVPCSKCAEWMTQGIILISVDAGKSEDHANPYRTGGWVVVKEDAFERLFKGEIVEMAKKMRWAFVVDEAWDAVGLPREVQQ